MHDAMASEWLTQTTLQIAAHTGLDPADLLVDAEASESLLDLAGAAAHATGERTNAPLLCFVLGSAVARGASLAACAEVVREAAGER
jgi:hypothetical protein